MKFYESDALARIPEFVIGLVIALSFIGGVSTGTGSVWGQLANPNASGITLVVLGFVIVVAAYVLVKKFLSMAK